MATPLYGAESEREMDCPKHGLQKTYFDEDFRRTGAYVCRVCFDESPEPEILFDFKKPIKTIDGIAKFHHMEIENEDGQWNDTLSTKDGWWIIHAGKKHYVYKIAKEII